MLNNTNSNKRGFTIVELLIVTVVIAILAAISIVAYNGIQTRSNNAAAATTSENIAKKIEAFNSITGAYPVSASSIATQLNGQNESSLTGSGLNLSTTLPTTDTTKRNTVKVQLCFPTATPAASTVALGYKVLRYDFTTPGWIGTPDQSGGTLTNCTDSATYVTQ